MMTTTTRRTSAPERCRRGVDGARRGCDQQARRADEAYPDAVRRSAFADADSLIYLLAHTKLALSKRAAVEIAVNPGHDGAAAATAYDIQAGKNKRHADDDANPAPKKRSKPSYDDDASFELDDSEDD